MISTTVLPLLSAGSYVTGWSLFGFIITAAILIFLNGAYVAYEFAVLTAKKQELEAGPQTRSVTAALDSLSDLSMQLAGAQLGITIVSLGLGYVAEPAFESIIGPIAGRFLSEDVTSVVSFVSALSIVVFLHLVFGEMVPKNVALAAPNATLRWLVLPYRAYLWLFRPIATFLNAIANMGCRAVGVEPRDEIVAIHSVTELLDIVSTSSQEGAIESDSAELLHGALNFSQRLVGEIAVPISELTSVRFGATPAMLERVVASSGQIRIPVLGPTKDHRLVGYFNGRDLLRIERSDRFAPMPKSLLRPVIAVSHDRSLIEVLRTLRSNRRPFAVVMGKGTEPVGMVAVEEIVEALLPSPGLQQPGEAGEEVAEVSADVAGPRAEF